jgi:hypothetical protein
MRPLPEPFCVQGRLRQVAELRKSAITADVDWLSASTVNWDISIPISDAVDKIAADLESSE